MAALFQGVLPLHWPDLLCGRSQFLPLLLSFFRNLLVGTVDIEFPIIGRSRNGQSLGWPWHLLSKHRTRTLTPLALLRAHFERGYISTEQDDRKKPCAATFVHLERCVPLSAKGSLQRSDILALWPERRFPSASSSSAMASEWSALFSRAFSGCAARTRAWFFHLRGPPRQANALQVPDLPCVCNPFLDLMP